MLRRTCRLVTLGCKVNQYDGQLVREALAEAGFREAAPGEPADVCVVNTCTVTHLADAEGRRLVRRLARQNPGAAILVTGCYAARDPQALRDLPGVAAVVERPGQIGQVLRRFGVRQMPARISRFQGHHRAFVKVQDGCILDCSFCVIPQVRPVLWSRRPEAVEREVRALIEAGFQEIVLTGIHLGHYGLAAGPGRGGRRLTDLVRRLVQIPGAWRLRLSSLEVTEVNDELVAIMAGEARLCPHLHLSLQSGSDAVLARMRRRYRVGTFLRRVERIRRRLDLPALTTDVIVGFPGETEWDFEQTLRVCRQVGFSRLHIFPFSRRPGTAAAAMPGQVPAPVIRERKHRAATLALELAQRYHDSLIGRQLQVLIERVETDGELGARGTAGRYVTVRLAAGTQERGRLVTARAWAAADGCLLAHRCDGLAVTGRTAGRQWHGRSALIAGEHGVG